MSFFKRRSERGDDEDTDEEAPDTIDPQLRLRTVRTAASSIAEAARLEDRQATRRLKPRGSRFFRRAGTEKRKHTSGGSTQPAPPPAKAPAAPAPAPVVVPGIRRNIYLNLPLPHDEADTKGEPLVRYVRNKVRTTKYTLLTFVPKNLYEQFRRVANQYFLALVVVQLFPVFGAASGQISMIPLVVIVFMTAVKDGIEDYRRATLDDEVNNSAATKLGGFRNVNQPADARNWAERALGLNAPGRVTKGVRRLRGREASEGNQIVLAKRPDAEGEGDDVPERRSSPEDAGRLEDIQSIDEHEHVYPPGLVGSLSTQSALSADAPGQSSTHLMADALDSRPSLRTSASSAGGGVVDYRRRGPGVARWERTLWKKLEVGDVVLLRDNEQVPADIAVLATSDADGTCFLETKNLDGETNLKARKSVRGTASLGGEADVERAAFVLDSEPPHANLYVYHGVLRYMDAVTGEARRESVTIDELLLRGCTVRNTDWVIGLVVFTGADTKIMLNGGETPSKRSKIERETNFNVLVNFLVVVVMCAVTGVGSGVLDGKPDTSSKFFEGGADATGVPAINGLVTFVSALIAFQNLVPVSLPISIEIVKTIQAFFIAQDVDMYYAPLDSACVPKTWNISDDLGQIEYVFSDKTGTLTQNVMEFQKCAVGGVTYGEGVTEAQRGAAARAGTAADLMGVEEQRAHIAGLKDRMLATLARAFKNRYLQPDRLTLVDPKLADALADRASPQRAPLIAFFRALAICHSVLADRSHADRPFHTDYKAESPDEAALVAAARDVGFPYVGRTRSTLDIECMGQAERYVPLKTLEFDSTRKRMSVVVRAPDGRIVLYCKGADTVIYQRLAADHDPALRAQTQAAMEAFANGGLRTLAIAQRVLAEDEYVAWARAYDAAAAAVDDREGALARAAAQVEHSLTLLGATALEDKLQEGVPEAIEMLHQAGIKLWILTGDKLQTAIEIGYSCNLLKADMDVMILAADSADGARALVEAGLNKIASVLGPPARGRAERGFTPNAKASFAVVIDGDTLRHALAPPLRPLFLALGTQCETVVCCRVSPAQKAETVKLVKEGRQAMTLAIGDGANDVAMIQEANIGCGLFGLEGGQAAMSADYAFGQFRFLTKLLLVHGRWSYQRVAAMHCNFFYKNVIWVFAMFWYLPWNSFDATYLYQYTFILLYNLIFTSLPVIVLGAFDQDLNARAALAFPQLYIRGIRGLEYTRTLFWLYMADGLYQSAVVYFVPYAAWTLGPAVGWTGRGIDSLADFGTTVSVAAIVAANTYVGMNTHYWTAITWASVVGSSLLMFVWIIIYSFFQSSDFINEVTVLFGGMTFWATIVLAVALALLPRFIVKAYTSSYAPLDKDIVREAWVRGDLKDRLGVEHRRARRGEAAPMMHARMASASEAEHDAYEPVAPRSPLPPLEKELDVGDGGAQYIVVAERTRSPAPAPGSRMSYYSASDIPPPSPAPPSTRTSRQSASASGALLSPARQEYLARGPHSPALELREPASPYPRADTSRASERTFATFATAREDVSAPGSPGAEPPWTGAMAL